MPAVIQSISLGKWTYPTLFHGLSFYAELAVSKTLTGIESAETAFYCQNDSPIPFSIHRVSYDVGL